jgi:hypothetical protein
VAESTRLTNFKIVALNATVSVLMALILVLPSAGAVKGREDKRRDRRHPRHPQAEVFFCEASSLECRTSINDFELDKIRDLFIFVAWREVRGEHSQELRFILPDGNLYQKVPARFTTTALSAPSLDIQTARRSRGEPTVISTLPVAGTLITQHSLTGTWQVQVYLDGRLITEASFILQAPRQ